jgi:hypothetical protein
MKKHCEFQVAEDLYIAPLTKEEFNEPMLLVNHSCNPNIGVKNKNKIIALRSIKKGEELVFDYGMIDDNDNHRMKCNCHSVNCRKVITGKDWKIPELQKRYKDLFPSFIKKKIV